MRLSGPHHPAVHDISVFCGDKEIDNWDKSTLYFQINDGDRLVGDSGYNGEQSKIVVKRDEHSQVHFFVQS